MGSITRLLLVSVIAVLGFVYVKISQVPPIPTINETYWGPGSPTKEDTSIKLFKINVPEEVIKDLQHRLNNALPFQSPLEEVNQNYGINTKLLSKIVDYWKNKYDWKQRQEFLNQFPQYKTNIQGLNIHFLRVKPQKVPKNVEVLPLLLLHGWPGSVREFYEILPILTTPQKGRNFVFEVIAPSLPGYGFSDGASKPGLGPHHMGLIFDKLMRRLNFENYYIQGGDWGSLIAHDMSILFADHVTAVHMNVCFVNTLWSSIRLFIGAYFPSLIVDEIEKDRIYPLSEKYSALILESGYMHLQATKPDTVGVALRDSPVGLAAYILEKFTTWTNPSWKNLEDGGLTKKFTFDQLLDNVMIYWVTRSITTSMRLYSENFNKARFSLNLDNLPIKIPSGCARFKYEIVHTPKSSLKQKNIELVHVTDYDDGGHFAAFELPEILANDLFDFVQKVRNLPKVQTKEL